MTAPNLQALTESTMDTLEYEATSGVTTVTGSTVATDHARKVESILATNIGDDIGWVSVWHRKGGVDEPRAYQFRVPLRSVVNPLLGSPLYMAEGDSLKVQANANDNVHVAIPYVDVTSA